MKVKFRVPGVSQISAHVIYRIRRVYSELERKFFLRSFTHVRVHASSSVPTVYGINIR